MIYNSVEIRDLWVRIYNENPSEFHTKFTKAYEVVAITSAILTGLSAAFVQPKSNTEGVVAPLAVVLGIVSFNTSVIMVLMVNSVQIAHVPEFIDRWISVALIPMVGVILSCFLVLAAMCLYVHRRIGLILGPVCAIAALWNVRFYFKIRRAVINLSKIQGPVTI